ncbi:proteoglycan 4b isoform X4 [Sinocyclocheilus anshuiensis]|uniref:proteoglycan 4b isoform X4 n=1 Tax=Sinocyclocheilus anshuiensis TaxID=1608454 RepID=UPI0007B8B236|nr:PREDICTED: proteoglycan 4-like isoform X4 [Sinocyclocheilus anshuiensis]
MTTHLSLLLLFAYASTGSSDPSSCRGRCGEGYYRGSLCQCDYECLSLNECCSDFTQMCTTKDSCKGRCGEPFHRGNPCHCDIDCVSFNQCCPDYENMCLVEDTALKPRKTATAAQRTANLCLNIKNKKSTETSNEEMTNDEGIGEELTIPEDESESTPSEGLVLSSTDASSMLPADENPTEGPSSATPTEGPTSTAPTEGPPSTEPTEGPSSTAPIEGPSSAEPTEGPTSTAPTEVPSSTAPTEGPPSTAPTEVPSSTAPTEGPPSTAPTEVPSSTAPTEVPSSTAPTEVPSSTAPTEVPSSTAPTEVPSSTAPTEVPSSTAPTEVPSSTAPTEVPSSTAPTEVPSSTAPTEVPSSTAPKEGPSSAEPTEGPSTTAPTEVPSSTAPTEGPSSTTPTEGPSSRAPTENSVTEMITKAQSEDPEELSSLKDPRATPVPKKTPSAPAPVKPTKNPIKPSIDENDKSEPKEPLKDLSGIVPIKPAEKPLKPSSDKNGKTDSIRDYQADDYDTNLCSGRPVSGLTTLRNGTIVVFRGHYFWTLDKQRNPDPPQLITKVWGIPSPIDTVYTRCNCQGKTYFFKGRNYWRFENGMMDPGFPKPISQGFGQIGHITAALSIPQYRSRRESVIFFRRGEMAQTYTYQVTPSCGKKPRYPVFTVRTRARRQAVLPGTDVSQRPQTGHFVPNAALGQVISISKTWRGFPTIVTSAVSVPSRVKEGYKYYVFSQNKYYSMKMEREKPVILKPATGPKESSATSFFKCPETQKN